MRLPYDVTGNPIDALAGIKVDRVFNIMHGRGGEDGVIAGRILKLWAFPIPDRVLWHQH